MSSANALPQSSTKVGFKPGTKKTPGDSGEGTDSGDKITATSTKPKLGFARGDEGDIRREDTLYETSASKDYVSRRVEPEDVVEIKHFLKEEDYNFFKFEDLNILFEKCCFNIVLSDVIETDRIVAAAFFDDKPIDPDLKTYAKSWKTTTELQKMIPINTIYLHLFARSTEVQTDILITEVIAYTFTCCPWIEYIVVECPNVQTKGCFSFCTMVKEVEVNPSGKKKKMIIIYDKERLFPSVKVREGRENDLDDLLPLLPINNEILVKEFKKSALTDVIALCDKNNQSAVAEWNSEAVGIISVTTDMNYEMLNGFYHLEPFHGLFKPHPKDKVHPYCYETKDISEIPVKEALREAKKVMDGLKGRRRQKADDSLAYSIEAQRDDCLVEYESDESEQNKSDEKHRAGHQFEARVSTDIITHGLRPPSPESALTEQQSQRFENIKDITERLRAGQVRKSEVVEVETQVEHSDTEDDWRRVSENVLKPMEKVDEAETKKEIAKKSYDEKFDPSTLNLLDFLTEFIVDEEEEEDLGEAEKDWGGEGDVAFITEPKKLEHGSSDDSSYDDINNNDSTGSLNSSSGSNTTATATATIELGELTQSTPTPVSDEVDALQLQFDPPKLSGPPIEELLGEGDGAEEWGGEDMGQEEEQESEELTAVAGKVQPQVQSSMMSIAMSPKMEKQSMRPTMKMATSFTPGLKKTYAKSRMLHGTGRSVFASYGDGLSGHALVQDMTFFQHKTEFQRRWSDDTLYLGKTGADKSFDEKIELMKKVWEVFQYMKQEGLTFESAKIYLSNTELNSLETADALTKGNLLKFLTLLLPDEKMYPFERYVKPKHPKYYGLPNALIIKLFNIDKKFNLRSIDLLREVFRFFPNREYLVVTIPQGSKEPAWLDHFVRVVPRIDCNYANELFVLHKAYLTSKLKVRRARISDIHKVVRLVETLRDKDKMLDDFKIAVCCKENQAFVLEVKNHANLPIVGMAVVSDELQSQNYHINYQLYNHTYYLIHRTREHAYVHHLIIYPIFQRFGRTFLKEIMRIMDKTCLYHRLYRPFFTNEITKHQSLLNNLDDWVPVMPRKRIHYNYLNLTDDSYDLERLPPKYATNYNDPFSVVYFGKKLSFEQKINSNTRIVFIGASESALACIAKMLCCSFRAYKRLSIIDTYGLPGQLAPNRARDEFFAVRKGGSSSSFTSSAEWAQRMGLENWANVVIGTATKIDREKKFVIVNNERRVPYDVLVLATGRQFQRIDCPEAEINDPNFIAFKKKTKRPDLNAKMIFPADAKIDPQADANKTKFKRETPKPKNVFTVNTEVEADIALNFITNYQPFMKRKKLLVFGGGLLSYACVRALLLFGIEPNKIVLITAPNNEVEWEVKSGYILTDTVRLPMETELKSHGVHLVEHYEFYDWETCPISGLVKRCYFFSPTETESKISFPTFALFCYRHYRVNDDIVSALAETYILYQEGIVIDENFRTNDPNIYAVGPSTTYKRILLANHQDHLFYQSEEIGQKLAEFLIDRTGFEGGGPAEVQTLEVLKFQRPFVRAIMLLGGWYYMYMRSPGAPHHLRCFDPNGKCEEACQCATDIVTGSVDLSEDVQQRYFKLRLDDQSRVVGIECMSKKPFSASNFMGLYGQHEILLNKMMERLEKGETNDLFDHFCQPWFGAFCVDHWEGFLQELQQLYKAHDIGNGRRIGDFITDYVASLDNPDTIPEDSNIIRNIWDSSGLKQEVEFKFLSFLKFHKFVLPMYARNDYVEDLLEERSTSTLYIPRTIKY